jgi:hypothetical protein
MENRTLSPNEIDDLFAFCQNNMIPYYDIQVELVDHLASSIEKIWLTNPDLSFQKALNQVSDDFGGRQGFLRIKNAKKVALRKTYSLLLWKFVAEFYKLPKIILTSSFALLFFIALGLHDNDQWLIILLLGGFVCFSIFYLFVYFPKHLKLRIPNGKKFWLSMLSERFLIRIPLYLGNVFVLLMKQEYHFSTLGAILFSVMVSFFFVLIWCDCFYIPKRINEHFEEQFPQFEIA